MRYQAQLNFVRDLLTGLHISSHILTPTEQGIPADIDLGLRSLLFDTDNYTSILEHSMDEVRERTIYRFYDEYGCNYIFMKLPNKTYFFMGPYLLHIPDRDYLEQRAQALSLSAFKTQQMTIYYTNLPVIEDENWLLTLANTLGCTIWGSGSHFNLEYIQYEIRDRNVPLPVSRGEGDPFAAPCTLSVLERNYENENTLMDAISNGKLQFATAVAASVFNNGTDPFQSDSLRRRKNDLVILKTLLRKAAEYGGVHPLHIHRLSRSYAKRIEEIRTIKESLQLQEEMIRDYCLLVKNHSLSQYSYYVGKAITLIHYDVTADLTLRAIAEQLNVNGSYLSSLFHKECGCTLTEYVNRRRLEHATYLLRDGSRRIQDIAIECGFQDTTYFIRLFKKQFGITPTVFRDQTVEKRPR